MALSRMVCKHENIRLALQAVYRAKGQELNVDEHFLDIEEVECIDCQAKWEGEAARQFCLNLLKGNRNLNQMPSITSSGMLMDFPWI